MTRNSYKILTFAALAWALLSTGCGSTKHLRTVETTVEWESIRREGGVDHTSTVDLADPNKSTIVDPTPTTITAPKEIVVQNTATFDLADPDEAGRTTSVTVAYSTRVDSGIIETSVDHITVEHPQKTEIEKITEVKVIKRKLWERTTFIVGGACVALLAVIGLLIYLLRRK